MCKRERQASWTSVEHQRVKKLFLAEHRISLQLLSILAIDVSSKWKWHLDDNIICMYMLVGIWFVIYQSLVDHPLRRLVRLQTFFVCVCRLQRVVPTRRRARRRRFRPCQSQMSALRPVMQKHSQAVLSHKQPPSSHKKVDSHQVFRSISNIKHHKFFQTETNIDHRLSFVFFFSSFFSLFYHSRYIQQEIRHFEW